MFLAENICVILESTCSDSLPNDYGDRCLWSCEQWEQEGLCDSHWSQQSRCTRNPFGKIKDFCRRSCDSCGNYRFHVHNNHVVTLLYSS